MIKKELEAVERPYLKEEIPDFRVGDTVEVHTRWIQEDSDGNRIERIAIFTGTVIARKRGGTRETFTVRRGAKPNGVEKVFPLHSPTILKIVVKRRPPKRVRRAKLYYLRERLGKKAKI